MGWRYHSENVAGNIHTAVEIINKFHPEWDIVHIESISGNISLVVHRTPVRPTSQWTKCSEQPPPRNKSLVLRDELGELWVGTLLHNDYYDATEWLPLPD